MMEGGFWGQGIEVDLRKTNVVVSEEIMKDGLPVSLPMRNLQLGG